jgi:hypothetical protein
MRLARNKLGRGLDKNFPQTGLRQGLARSFRDTTPRLFTLTTSNAKNSRGVRRNAGFDHFPEWLTAQISGMVNPNIEVGRGW